MPKPWKYTLLADWDIPLHISMIESIQLYRGKNIRGCDHLYKETLVFETYDLSVTEYEDEVEGFGLWAYAAYAKDSKGNLSLCATNVCLIQDTLRIEVISEHGSVIGPLTGRPNTYLDISLEVDYGYVFLNWSSDDYVFENPTSNPQSILLDKSMTIQANYRPEKFHLTLDRVTDGFGDKIGKVDESLNGVYDYLTDATIRAVNTNAYTFTEWIGINIADRYSIETTIHIDRDFMVAVADFDINTLSVSIAESEDGSYAKSEDTIEDQTIFLAEGLLDEELDYGEPIEVFFIVSEYQDEDGEYVFRYRSDEFDGWYEGVPKYQIESFEYLDENGNDISAEIEDLEEFFDPDYGEFGAFFTLTKNVIIKPIISVYDIE